MSAEKRKARPKLPAEIWALGFVSLLMDTASESIHALLPVFLVSVLGASMTSVGILEGLAEAVALVVKVFSGPMSDWIGRRKPLVVLGYSMGALSKPFFAVATSVGHVYSARLFDRIGKGVRGAPRDALIADVVPVELRGQAYGLRQSLDTVGAFLGPVLAIFLMATFKNDYRLVFWLAGIPAFLAVGILVFGIREKETASSSKRTLLSIAEIKRLPFSFWTVAGAGAVFQLARFSEAFIVLRARDFGLSIEYTPLVLIVMNIVYALAAYPIGHCSDRVPRERFLYAGFAVLMLSDLVLGLGSHMTVLFIGIALWGLHLGLTQGILATLVADHSPAELRGTAFGLFNLLSALALFLANGFAGIIWDRLGGQGTFLIGAALAFASGLAIIAVTRKGGWSRIGRLSPI